MPPARARHPLAPLAIGARFHPDVSTEIAGHLDAEPAPRKRGPDVIAVEDGALVAKQPGTSAVLIIDRRRLGRRLRPRVGRAGHAASRSRAATASGSRGSIGLAVGEDITLVPALFNGAQRLAGDGDARGRSSDDARARRVLRDGSADRRRLRARAPGKTTITRRARRRDRPRSTWRWCHEAALVLLAALAARRVQPVPLSQQSVAPPGPHRAARRVNGFWGLKRYRLEVSRRRRARADLRARRPVRAAERHRPRTRRSPRSRRVAVASRRACRSAIGARAAPDGGVRRDRQGARPTRLHVTRKDGKRDVIVTVVAPPATAVAATPSLLPRTPALSGTAVHGDRGFGARRARRDFAELRAAFALLLPGACSPASRPASRS